MIPGGTVYVIVYDVARPRRAARNGVVPRRVASRHGVAPVERVAGRDRGTDAVVHDTGAAPLSSLYDVAGVYTGRRRSRRRACHRSGTAGS